jgi:CHRD domain
MRKLGLFAAAIAGAALVLSGVSLAQRGDDDENKRSNTSAKLIGYEETPSISTKASGTFEARIEGDRITFRLRYSGLEGGNATAAHLHLGQRHTAGGVSAFLCGGSTKPACPPGTTSAATVDGTIMAADVIGPGGQGIAATQFDELVAAIRAGAVYANVHTGTYPNGEIRGQLRGKGGRNGDNDD